MGKWTVNTPGNQKGVKEVRRALAFVRGGLGRENGPYLATVRGKLTGDRGEAWRRNWGKKCVQT